MVIHRHMRQGLTHLIGELKFRLRTSWSSPWCLISDRLADRIADRKFGIASSECRTLRELGLDLPDCSRYQPISYSDLRKLLDSIGVSRGDVFLDFGSGMGRALCVAARYPFRAVLGVEVSTELCAIAKQNVDRARPKLLRADIRVINANALSYEIPAEASVIYFFNPFGRAILSTVLENIATSLRKAPRQIKILFYGTASSEDFRQEAERCGWLALRSTLKLPTGSVGLIYLNALWNSPGASVSFGTATHESTSART
jgi:SAM-dependent methyltransferase